MIARRDGVIVRREVLMKDKPDVLCEVGARAHGACFLVFFAAVWVAAVALVVAVPGFPAWWAVCWVAAATLTVAIVAGRLLPLVVRGGAYRVVVQDDWLRVDSPHRVMGPSFAVALPDITALVVQASNESLDRYEVHTRGGEKFPLENGVGEAVFKAIRLLHPQIPLDPEVPASGEAEAKWARRSTAHAVPAEAPHRTAVTLPRSGVQRLTGGPGR
jgi:hypothetical protein